MIARPAGPEVARLRALPANADLLDRWADGGQIDRPESFDRLYEFLLAHSRANPQDTLEAIDHLRNGLGRSLEATKRARLRRLRGHALQALGRIPEALESYASAWNDFAAANAKEELGATAVGWVFALALAGDPQRALEITTQGRQHIRRDQRTLRARLENNLGNAWLLNGQYKKAAERYRYAMREFQREGRTWDAGGCAHNLAILASKDGDLKHAKTYYQQAKVAFADSGLTLPSMYAEAGLASIDLVRGNWDDALESLNDLRQKFGDMGDARAEAQMHRELATLFSSVGAIEAARPESERALKIYASLGLDSDSAQMTFLHGRLLATSQWNHDAGSYLEQARQRWDSLGNARGRRRAEVELARVALRQGHTRQAMELLRSAQTYLDRHDPKGEGALCRSVYAEAQLAAGRPGVALRLLRKARQAARLYPARLERPHMALLTARAYANRSAQSAAQPTDAAQAVKWARKAVAELEVLLLRFGHRHYRSLVAGSRDRVYHGAVEIALEFGGRRANALALDLLTRARSPSLIEDLLHGQDDSLQPEVRAAIARLRDDLLAEGEGGGNDDTRFQSLQVQVQDLENRLHLGPKRPPRVVKRALAHRGYEQWRTRLGRRDLVLYDEGPSGWRAFMVSADGPIRVVNLDGAAEAIRRVWMPLRLTMETAAHAPKRRRHEFLLKTLDDSLQAIEKLRTALWQPLETSAEHVVVVPHGALHGIPLEALAPVSTVVSRLPHPALLRRDRARRKQRALLLHGPGGATEHEVEEIRKVLEDSKYEVAVGSHRSDVETQSAPLGILHMATHGTFHREGWLMSGLKLEDGWMGFEQLRRSWAEGALLYFASCESGLTANRPGEELDGWLTAGLGAGAREMILTLWKLDDDAATAFARHFYPAWARGATAPEAAAQARSAIAAEEPHPFRWAPFLAVG